MTWLRRTSVVLLAAAALLAPTGADAAWTVEGRGYGHGVGLSQYGAYGYAKHGRGFREILDHYFVHTALGHTVGGDVRVLLDSGEGSVGFSGAGHACGRELHPRRSYSFAADSGGVVLRDADGDRIVACGVEGRAGDTVRIGKQGKYRGRLVARNDEGSLLVINSVNLEGYVKGVVPNEVPSSWPRAALRAQAAVARSYGIATSRGGPFDHYDDVRSQVYGGKSSETATTNEAVAATERKVLTYRGEVATTYYFSTSGGQTENAEFGFAGGAPVPYLKSVRDPFDDASPVHRWRQRFTDEQMEHKLAGLYSGELRRIDVEQRGRSPRIVRARVVGSQGGDLVTGPTLRAKLGLRSTWAFFEHR